MNVNVIAMSHRWEDLHNFYSCETLCCRCSSFWPMP